MVRNCKWMNRLYTQSISSIKIFVIRMSQTKWIYKFTETGSIMSTKEKSTERRSKQFVDTSFFKEIVLHSFKPKFFRIIELEDEERLNILITCICKWRWKQISQIYFSTNESTFRPDGLYLPIIVVNRPSKNLNK